MSGLVSVIIPVHNRSSLLQRAVESVLSQTYPDWEILVVDDGSTDDTVVVAERLAGGDRRIRVFRQANGGPGMARETGRIHARGDYLQYLDSDDFLLPNKFADQVSALEREPGCDVAYGATRLVDEKGRVLMAPYKGSGEDHAELFPQLLVERWWNTHTPLYRRALCDKVGPWSNMRLGEDWEYDARAGALRTKLVNCRSYVSHHTSHGGSRLTGGELSPEKLADTARLLKTLGRCAREAGVSPDGPEWKHFQQWMFLEVRRTAAAGLAQESRELLTGVEARELRWRIKLYRGLCHALGARVAAKTFDVLAALRHQ